MPGCTESSFANTAGTFWPPVSEHAAVTGQHPVHVMDASWCFPVSDSVLRRQRTLGSKIDEIEMHTRPANDDLWRTVSSLHNNCFRRTGFWEDCLDCAVL